MLYLLLVIICFVLIRYKIKKWSKYWSDKGVKQEPGWFPIGNMGPVILRRKHIMDIVMEAYYKYSNERYFGFMQLTQKVLILRDLDLIRKITVRDFDHFHDHRTHIGNDKDNILSKCLIGLTGDDWKKLRATLSPIFTSTKMQNIYNLMVECSETFTNHFQTKEQVAVELQDIFTRFGTDIIASTVFGIQIDSLEEPNNTFYKMGQNLLHFSPIRVLVINTSPALADMLGLQLISKDVTGFFRTIVKDNIDKRKKQEIVRSDFIQVLMEAQKGQLTHEGDKDFDANEMELTDEHIVAQAMLFFLAGCEIVSITACFMAYELAINPGVQKILQEEIDSHRGKISYETLLSLKYLDQVICETLRKWPPGFHIDRVCTKDYPIVPLKSDEKMVVIEKGTSLLVPVMAIHRDPQFFSEPNKFDPERFSDENRSKILTGTYLPFGTGPRNCIGSRFGLLQIKTLFYHLLSKYEIVPIQETEIPLRISPKQYSLLPKNGFKLGLRTRNN